MLTLKAPFNAGNPFDRHTKLKRAFSAGLHAGSNTWGDLPGFQ